VTRDRHGSASRGRRSRFAIASAGALLVTMATAPLAAQYPGEPRWSAHGDLGGVLGGRWLDGEEAPTVSSRTGVTLSLGVQRVSGGGVAGGLMLRVASQPLQLRERMARWDGGTLTDVQLIGTVAVPVDRSDHRRADLEFGAGLSALSGARDLYPFSASGRLVPAIETALVLFRSRLPRDDRGIKPLGVFVRYGVLRLDPVPEASTLISANRVSAGWVGRISAGVRVER